MENMEIEILFEAWRSGCSGSRVVLEGSQLGALTMRYRSAIEYGGK